MNYATIFVGLLTLAAIPDDAGWLQFALQGIFGLTVFIAGSIVLINKDA
jgi:hypothetical protein